MASQWTIRHLSAHAAAGISALRLPECAEGDSISMEHDTTNLVGRGQSRLIVRQDIAEDLPVSQELQDS